MSIRQYNQEQQESQDLTTTVEFEYGSNYEYWVDATIKWSYEGKDGIGGYEYHGSKFDDEGEPSYEIMYVDFKVFNEEGDEVELDDNTKDSIMEIIHWKAEPDFD